MTAPAAFTRTKIIAAWSNESCREGGNENVVALIGSHEILTDLVYTMDDAQPAGLWVWEGEVFWESTTHRYESDDGGWRALTAAELDEVLSLNPAEAPAAPRPTSEAEFIDLLEVHWPDVRALLRLRSHTLPRMCETFAADAFVRQLDPRLPACVALREEMFALQEAGGVWTWVRDRDKAFDDIVGERCRPPVRVLGTVEEEAEVRRRIAEIRAKPTMTPEEAEYLTMHEDGWHDVR